MKYCSKCNSHPALSYHAYCYTCLRLSKGQNPIPKHRRDVTNKDKCCKCKSAPKAKGKQYCRECFNQYQRDWTAKRGGWWSSLTDEQKKKSTVRAFINHKVHRGKMKRLPCEVCGSFESEHHHLNYNPRTLDVVHLCQPHHEQVEKLKNNNLTDRQAIDYLVSICPKNS